MPLTQSGEERRRVLEMVAEGKLKPEEAAKVLEALGSSDRAAGEAREASAKWIRVRVSNTETGKLVAHVNLPLALAEAALRFVPRGTFDGAGVDPRELLQAIRAGGPCRLIDVVDEEQHQKVEVVLE